MANIFEGWPDPFYALTERPIEEMKVTEELGDWYVWGDGREPVLENVDYETMKEKVDNDTTGELYGEQQVTCDVYEGGE